MCFARRSARVYRAPGPGNRRSDCRRGNTGCAHGWPRVGFFASRWVAAGPGRTPDRVPATAGGGGGGRGSGSGGGRRGGADDEEDVILPNGKSQKEEILKAEHQQNLKDAAELADLAEQLKMELEKNDRYILSMATLKKTDDIEKLAKRIRARLRHN